MKKNRQKTGNRPQSLMVRDLAAVRGGDFYGSDAIVGGGKGIVGGLPTTAASST